MTRTGPCLCGVFLVLAPGWLRAEEAPVARDAPMAPDAAEAVETGVAPEAGTEEQESARRGPPTGGRSPIAPVSVTTETKRYSVSTDRVAFGYSSETIERVTTPVDSALMGTFSVGYSGDTDGNTKTGLFTLGVRYLDPTGDFPDAAGGFRLAFSFEMTALGFAGVFTYPTVSDSGYGYGSEDDEDEESEKFGRLGATAGIGVNLLNFFSQSPGAETQRGVMLKVGLGAGGAWASGGATDGVELLIVPQAGLEIPSFNPGTGEFSSFAISGFVIPMDPAYFSLSLGGSF